MTESLLPNGTAQGSFNLSWHNINVTVPGKKKSMFRRQPTEPIRVLQNVSGKIKSGSLVAVMGSSGSGKTTLLDVLTHRILGDVMVSGVVCVNGKRTDGNEIAGISAYVQQDDLFFAALTVKEHLWFQAMLRMDPHIKMSQRLQRVEDVLNELDLSKCANTPIGNPAKGKSISGGERKRLSFASEILTNPALLFCDEPTSGLDSFMALNIVQTLRNMTRAASGKTVMCTIHQPSPKVFDLFDSLVLLSNGKLVYIGPTDGVVDFFSEEGHPCPVNCSPADFIIDVVATIPGQEEESKAKVEKICKAFAESDRGKALAPRENELPALDYYSEDTSAPTKNYQTGFFNQFRYLLWRAGVASLRDRSVFFARLCQILVVALFTGLLYLRQENNQKGVQNINGVIFLVVINFTFSNIYTVLHTFPYDIPIVKREHRAGMYTTFAYYLTRMLADCVQFTILPIMFSSIVYWMVGMKADFLSFVIFTATVIYLTYVVVSFGYFISCATGDAAIATVLASPVVVPLMLFAGFMLNDASVPVYFTWLAYLSWFKYVNEMLCLNQWHNFGPIGCEFEEPSTLRYMSQGNTTVAPTAVNDTLSIAGPSPTSRCFRNGEEVLVSLSYSINNYTRDCILMLVLLMVFRLIAYLLLIYRVGYRRNIRPMNKVPATADSNEKV